MMESEEKKGKVPAEGGKTHLAEDAELLMTVFQTVTSTVSGRQLSEEGKEHSPFADILQRSERRKSG